MCWGDPWVSALKTSLANQDLHRKAAGVHTCLPLRPLGHLPPYILSLGSSLKDEGRLCLPVLMAVTIAGSAVEPVMAELFLLSTGLNTDLLTKTIFKGLPLFFSYGRVVRAMDVYISPILFLRIYMGYLRENTLLYLGEGEKITRG